MTPLPTPGVPWQITGNHWLSLPCIHPGDGAVHAVGLLHRGARGAIELAGGPEFIDGKADPLLRPVVTIAGRTHRLDTAPMAWERALDWLPTFTTDVASLRIRGTVFAPAGRDADLPGAVYALSIENRGSSDADVTIALEGVLGHRQQRVRTARPFDDAHLAGIDRERIILEGSGRPGMVALAIAAEGGGRCEATGGERPRFTVGRSLRIPAGGREQAAFHIAAAPERDGALATVDVMRRMGWRALLAATRDVLSAMEQSSGNEPTDRLIARHLAFAYFGAIGRALDDAQFYMVRTRLPWHERGVTVRDWEGLLWTLPAIQLADATLARELLLRMCEVHGYAPGRGVHYLDGALFEPGFSLEGLTAWPVAIDRYIRETGDDQIVEEPVIADTLYLCHEELAARRDKNVPLYATDLGASGAPAALPFTLHGNALAAQALEVLRRTLDEETARDVEDPAAVRAAIGRHFATDPGSRKRLATAVDLAGGVRTEDDPSGSLLWLPLYETLPREDSTYRRTIKALPPQEESMAWRCAQLIGPDSAAALEWLRRAPLDNGVGAELVNGDGTATGNGGDATLSALAAWTAWYAVHALGSA